MKGIVAIVGRPNVGKSTLFNRLIGERKAIVDNFSGVTRDRHYGKCEWLNKTFTVIDTGGFVPESKDIFEKHIADQVLLAMKEADVLLFMVDVMEGITDLDKAFAKVVRKSNKPCIIVTNKADNNDRLLFVNEFYALGFDMLFPISSQSGFGTGDLLDEVIKFLPTEEIESIEEYSDTDAVEEVEVRLPRIALIGRPNVGKSSLCNALLGEERNIVTDIPGTTRDSINTHYNYFGNEFVLIDTAGVRKKSKVSEDIEFYSVMRTLRTLEDADIILLMIDATLGMESQDLNLFSLAEKNGKGIVILVNKWDLVEKDTMSTENFKKDLLEKLAPFTDVPIVFISATTKQRIFKAVETAIEVYQNMSNKVSTSKLNDVLLPIIEKTPPPALKGKYIKIKYITQLKTKKVTILFFCNLPQYINESYKRFLENRLREHFNFTGVPISIYFRKK